MFVLIGDNYAKLGNNYQAQATYESILENYNEDKSLVDEIKTKLENVKNAALLKSNLDMSTDTLKTVPLEEIK